MCYLCNREARAELAAAVLDHADLSVDEKPDVAVWRGVEVPVTDAEVRVTSPTGGQKGTKAARLGGADPLAMQQLAKVYGHGEQKYARFNYLLGYKWSFCIDALYRHFLAFQAGEEIDPESGLPHMAHAAWHALALVSFSMRGIGEDDRAPRG